MARAFEVAGVGVLEGKRRGTHLRGSEGAQRWCGVRGAIDSSFNLVATHPSSRPEVEGERRYGGEGGRRGEQGGGG